MRPDLTATVWRADDETWTCEVYAPAFVDRKDEFESAADALTWASQRVALEDDPLKPYEG